ncbi:MAG: hypothetical protein AAB874_07040 [Patescibacteria group bacterium]
MTHEVFIKIGAAATKLNKTGTPQQVPNLEFRLPNPVGLSGVFETQLVAVEESSVQLLLSSKVRNDPFTIWITKETLLSEAVFLEQGAIGNVVRDLVQKLNQPLSGTHEKRGRTRY